MTSVKEGTITVSVEERKLSDGSSVYDVHIVQANCPDDQDDVIICACRSREDAQGLAEVLIHNLRVRTVEIVNRGNGCQ